jgi:hypothetical protein
MTVSENKWFAEEQALKRYKRARKLYDLDLITEEELTAIKADVRRSLGLPPEPQQEEAQDNEQ